MSTNLPGHRMMVFVGPGWVVGFNVRGEPVFSVMAAGWFCEKSG
jgi:hypothetical protein